MFFTSDQLRTAFCSVVWRPYFLFLSLGAFFPSELSLQEWIPPLIFSGLCSLLLILPFWLVQKQSPGQSFPQILCAKWGKGAALPLFLYALWFLLEAVLPLVLFLLFLSRSVEPLVPVLVVSLALAAAALYASRRGTKAMGRAAVLLSAFLALGIVLLTAMLLTKQNSSYWQPFWQVGAQTTAKATLFLLARGSGLGPFLFLSGQTRTHAWRSFCLWDAAATAIACVLSGAASGAMGIYLNNQTFPLYTAASYAETGPARGLGAVVIGMWLFSVSDLPLPRSPLLCSVRGFHLSEGRKQSCSGWGNCHSGTLSGRFLRSILAERRVSLLGFASIFTCMRFFVAAPRAFEKGKGIRSEKTAIARSCFPVSLFPVQLQRSDKAGQKDPDRGDSGLISTGRSTSSPCRH